MFAKLRQKIRAYFFTGLLVLLPALVSVKVFYWLLTYVDQILGRFLAEVLGRYFFGFGIALTVALIMAVGLIAQNYLGKKLVGLIEAIFDRLPFIRTVYSVVRQLIEPFSSESGNAFRQAVLIEYPMAGRLAIGFVANEHVGARDGEKLVTVFLPSNHLHLGYLVVMPEKDVIHVDLTVEEALKMIVSCGIVVPRTVTIRNMKLVKEPNGPVA